MRLSVIMNNNLKSRGFKALLATQFLGAFNDNAFKLIISFIAVEHMIKSAAGAQYLSAASAFFILPFLLFSSYAGFFADRVSKRTIMIYAKFAELAIMTLGMIALFSGNFAFIYAVLFLMGTQSAFFGPAKYGILPEVLTEEEISEGNGLMQMWTFLAIILGMAFGGFLMTAVKGKAYLGSIAFIIISLLGIITSFYIHKVLPSGSKRKFQINFLSDIWSTIKIVKEKRPMYLSMTGIVYFWFLGALFQLNILLYTSKMMHVSQLATGLLLTVVALGVGTGSFLAGKLSRGKIEFGFVPLGSVGLSIFSILLAFSYASIPFTVICLVFLGISSGFFVIPLNAYIQENSPKDSRGKFLATTNFLSFTGILAASGMLWLILEVIGLSPAGAFGFLGGLTIISTIYIVLLLPDSFSRFLALISVLCPLRRNRLL